MLDKTPIDRGLAVLTHRTYPISNAPISNGHDSAQAPTTVRALTTAQG
jgi:hypothetical protein